MKLILAPLVLLLAIALAACGGNDDNAATASSTPAATVSLDRGVLVDSTGAALYSSDQEKSGKVVCTGGCTEVWLPLEAQSSAAPTAGDGVSGTLGAVARPDGTRQVTLDGRPLYRFAEDTAKGKATGDNVSDSFGGHKFTWHSEGDGGAGSGSASGGSGSYSY
jgi:predicted lipoprotein with Yx(FWY)xxD motif